MPVYKGSYKCKKCGAFPWRYKIGDNPDYITLGEENLHATGHLYIDEKTIQINLRCPICSSDYPIKRRRQQ